MNTVQQIFAGIGVVVGFLFALLLVYFGLMVLYYVIRRKIPDAKYSVEVFSILFIVCVSLCIKIGIQWDNILVALSEKKDLVSGLSGLFRTVYGGISVLSFEGLTNGESFNEGVKDVAYVCSSLLTAALFVSIVTTKVNYELFSVVALRFKRKRCADIYVFTALTEETLMLAKSIKNTYERDNLKTKNRNRATREELRFAEKVAFAFGKKIEENAEDSTTQEIVKKQHKKKYIIVFGGDIEAFDRRNPLCVEAMKEGFWYWSHAQSGEKSIAESLYLTRCRNVDCYDRRFMVFAFDRDDKGSPQEEKNMEAVFEDTERRIDKKPVSQRKLKSRKYTGMKDQLRIEYVILTKREINYQAYDKKNREFLKTYWLNHPQMTFTCDFWCSELHERHIVGFNGTQINVKYDDCNPFGMIAGDFGEIERLSKHTTKTASDSTIVAFNSLSELFAAFMANFEIPTDGTEYIPSIGNDARDAYTLFHKAAVDLYNNSRVSFTKNISNDLAGSAVIGVNHPYTMTFGTDVSPECIDFQTVIANLFGFSSKTTFMNCAKNLASAYAQYRTDVANSTPVNEALENGCFYTANGSFVFPLAVKNNLSSTVLAYVILDAGGLVSVWVNDITAVLWATSFDASYHKDGTGTIDNEFFCKNILFVRKAEETFSNMEEMGKNNPDVSPQRFLMRSKREQGKMALSDEEKGVCGAWVKALEQNVARTTIVDVWNESLATARIDVSKMFRVNRATIAEDPSDTMRVWLMGFGGTAQAITHQLYTNLVRVDDNRRSARFYVEAFDPDMRNIGGLYRAMHPSCIYCDGNEIEAQRQEFVRYIKQNVKTADIEESLDLIMPSVTRYLKEKAIADRDARFRNRLCEVKPEVTDEMLNEMSFPQFVLNEVSCMDLAFFSKIDKSTGRCEDDQATRISKTLCALRDALESKKDEEPYKIIWNLIRKTNGKQSYREERPDVIVISTGDDFRNIQLANALITDIVRETNEQKCKKGQPGNGGEQKPEKKQTVIVYVRDPRNNSLLVNANGVWGEQEKNVLRLESVTVIISGNTDTLYTHKAIVDHEDATKYVFGYKRLEKAIDSRLKDYAKEIKTGTPSESTGLFLQKWAEYSRVLIEALSGEKRNGPLNTSENNKIDEILREMKQDSGVIYPMMRKVYDSEKIKHWDEEKEKEWLAEPPFNKESNRSAQMFGPILRARYDARIGACKTPQQIGELYAELSLWEHARWVRFHIVNGWSTGKGKKDELLLSHPCIAPYAAIGDDTIFYDLINVLWAAFYNKEPKNLL